MEAIRSPKCSLVSCAVWICSFKTLIWPSNFPLVTSVPAMESFRLLIFSSICAIASSIAAYSLFIFSCCSLVSVRCSLAISKFFPASLRSCSIRSTSKRNILTSYSFSSSFFFKYKCAFSDWRSNGANWRSNSERMSLTRTRFSLSCSNFFCAVTFLRLYFTIPAASSKSSRRSSGFPLKIRSICPWPIME